MGVEAVAFSESCDTSLYCTILAWITAPVVMQKSVGVCTCNMADASSGAAAAKISGKSKNIQPLGEANLRDRRPLLSGPCRPRRGEHRRDPRPARPVG